MTKHRTTPKVFITRIFAPSSAITNPISSISSTITRDTSNKNIENSSNGQGFVSDMENRVTAGANLVLAKEHNDKNITGEVYFFCSIVAA